MLQAEGKFGPSARLLRAGRQGAHILRAQDRSVRSRDPHCGPAARGWRRPSRLARAPVADACSAMEAVAKLLASLGWHRPLRSPPSRRPPCEPPAGHLFQSRVIFRFNRYLAVHAQSGFDELSRDKCDCRAGRSWRGPHSHRRVSSRLQASAGLYPTLGSWGRRQAPTIKSSRPARRDCPLSRAMLIDCLFGVASVPLHWNLP